MASRRQAQPYENADTRYPSTYVNTDPRYSSYQNTDARIPQPYENADPRLPPQSYDDDAAYQNMTPAPYNPALHHHDSALLHPNHGELNNGRQSPARVEDVELGNMNPAYTDHTGERRLSQQQPRPHSDSDASSVSYQSDNLDKDEILERERIASSLQDPESVLSMLPSRQMGHTISRASSGNKWMHSRRRSTIRRGTIHRQGSLAMAIRKDYENMDMDRLVEQILADDDEMDNEARATMRRRETIRQISSGMSTKRRIREQVRSQSRAQRDQQDKVVGLCTAWWYQLTYNWESFKEGFANWTYSLELWRHSIKKIEGNFGSGVVSYFLLLKWLLLLNIPVFILSFSFIFVPQLFYCPSAKDACSNNGNTNDSVKFRPGNLLTGGGWFENTELYYGYYFNESIRFGDVHYYSIPFAYLLTNAAYFLLILIVLAVGTSSSYREYFITGDKKYNYYVAKVFCGWDFSITAPNTATLKHKSLYLELAEHLSQHHMERKKTLMEIFGWVFLRTTSNVFVIAVIAAAAFLVFYLYEDIVIDTGSQTIDEIVVPLVITGFNLLLPYMFSAIGRLEQYDNPRNRLYMSLFRTFLMKAAILIVLCYFWLSPCKGVDCPDCWETYVGMEIYKLVLLDFMVQSCATFFLEFIRRVGRDRCCHGFTQPEFDIARNTMDLIQAQTYTWIGMYFSPLLMIFCIVKLVLLFYVKKISVLANCKPSLQPWRAGLSKTIFLLVLCVMFGICAGAVAYSLSEITPSATCGPFRGKESAFDIVIELINVNTSVWTYIVNFFTTPGVVAVAIAVLCLAVYYYRVVTQGRQQTVKQLKQQIILEGKDKRFLLKMLQEAVDHRRGKGGGAGGGGAGEGNEEKKPQSLHRRIKKDKWAANGNIKPSPKKKKGKGKGDISPVRTAPQI